MEHKKLIFHTSLFNTSDNAPFCSSVHTCCKMHFTATCPSDFEADQNGRLSLAKVPVVAQYRCCTVIIADIC